MNHSFDVDIAVKIGVEGAIIVENLRFWIAKNQANRKHFYNNRYWSYNSVKALGELFPYWSEKQIYRLLTKLEADGVIVSGNFNTNTYDRTKWYSLNEEFHFPKKENGNAEIGNSLTTDVNTGISNTDVLDNSHSVKNSFSATEYLRERQVSDIVIADWLHQRKMMKATATQTAIKGIEREATKAGISLEDALSMCCQNGWRGFSADWIKQGNKAKSRIAGSENFSKVDYGVSGVL